MFLNLDICILSRFILPRTKFVQVQSRFFLVEPEVEPSQEIQKRHHDGLSRGFSVVIDREDVFPSIVRVTCNDWRKINCATFVTDVLTVSCKRPEKLACRSNSLCFCGAHASSHVSSEIYTFTCLLGHACPT